METNIQLNNYLKRIYYNQILTCLCFQNIKSTKPPKSLLTEKLLQTNLC